MAPVCTYQFQAILTDHLTEEGVIQLDPWLSPFKDALRSRYSHTQKWTKTINETEGGLDKFSRGYQKYGLNVLPNGDIVYREWAPNAKQAFLIGDFSASISPLSMKTNVPTPRWLEPGIPSNEEGRFWSVGGHRPSQRCAPGHPTQYQSQGSYIHPRRVFMH